MLGADYRELFAAIAECAATLSGLLFVALTVAGRQRPADRPAVVGQVRAAASIVVFSNGAGFDPEAAHAGHIGLSTMAERAEAIGAKLTVTSTPGAGTTVTVSLPLV